jgi:hypothetical protein
MSTPSPIDVCFSFDSTGSMFPCLTQVRRVVAETTRQLFSQVPNLHVGIMAHGDYCDGPDFLTVLDLTDNQAQICDFVQTVKATHGGDAPEAYEAVLARARALRWRSGHAKVLVLIGDDEPHGPSYPLNVNHLDWRNEAGLLHEQGIHCYAVQALARYHATPFYRELAQIGHGVHLELHQFAAVQELVMAVCYQQAGPEVIQRYEQQVQDSGRMTDSVGAMFDVLAGRTVRAIHRAPAPAPWRIGGSGTPSAPKPAGKPSGPLGAVKIGAIEVKEDDLTPVHPSRFQILTVDHDVDIKGFVQENGLTFRVGRGFYQFTRTVEVQRHKEVVLVNNATGAMWTGKAARAILGLPDDRTVSLRAGQIPGYTAFIQSTSNNRKLLAATKFLYEMTDRPG